MTAEISPVPQAGPAGAGATLPAPRPWHALDRPLHAAQARFTAALSPATLVLAYTDWAMHLANAPFRRIELGEMALAQWARLGQAMAGAQVIAPPAADHRFQSEAWLMPPYRLMHQAFLLAEEWLAALGDAGPAVNRHNAALVQFTNRQILDAFSPSNIPWANPDVLNETVQHGGRNLRDGLRNLLADQLAALSGKQPESPLVVGQDVACTPGRVIFRNTLIELIQYAPATSAVRPEPVLIVPAWIMKYYILDLSAQNSMVRYLVSQGFTVFMISWHNPGAGDAHLTMEDYRRDGVMAAMDAIAALLPGHLVHAAGYCLGGTLLSIAAAAMARDDDERLASVSLFAAQTDFTEAGELQIFISEGQLAFLEDVMASDGYLDSRAMAGAFQMLRSNDLFWSRLVSAYCLGRRETQNDLMAWNADATRMPAAMHAEYLRRMFLDNDLAEGRFPAAGKPVSLNDIDVPLFVVGTETDHIAPWRSVYKIQLLNPGEITFVLTNGGHNAGIVSEPGHKHRAYRLLTHEKFSRHIDADGFLAATTPSPGSWWEAWARWLAARSAPAAPPPPMGRALCEAPGTYVLER